MRYSNQNKMSPRSYRRLEQSDRKKPYRDTSSASINNILRFFSTKQRSRCLELLILVIVLSSILREANGQQNSSTSPNSTATLPLLSERAGGLNSRYLSASGTASLAAATVAAAAAASNQQQSLSPTTTTASTSALQASQDANRSFLVHQQQQQQQQQQQSHQVTSNNGLANQQQQQQVSTGINPQQHQQQQQISQQQISASANSNNNIGPTQTPPTFSTRYSYNPATGQYVPIDSFASTASGPPAIASNAVTFVQSPSPQQVLNGGFGSQVSNQQNFGTTPSSSVAKASSFLPNGNFQSFQNGPSNIDNIFTADSRGQQQVFQPSQLLQVTSSSSANQRPPVPHITLGNYPYSPYSHWQRIPAFLGPIFGNVGNPPAGASGSNQYTRRNGLTVAQSNRFGSGVFNGGGVDDDSNGLFTQLPPQQQYLFEQQLPSDTNGYGTSPAGFVVSGNPQQQQALFQQDSQQPQPQQKLPGTFGGDGGSTTGGFNDYSVRANNDQCVAADNRHGTCYQASECIRRGGTPMGKCGNGGSNSVANLLDSAAGSSHVCCLFDITCGQFATERFVYFRNPNYPNTFDQSRMCRAKIGKLDKGICQFRLDLLRFDVAKPTNGNCSTDMFVVSGQNENYVIPKICGFNDGQHYYVGVDESGVITLHMMMMGYYRRSFEILITQIPCRSDYAAPAHCLQYFIGTHGTIKSFNYDDEQYITGQPRTNYEYLLQQQQQDTGALVTGGPNNGPTAPYGLQFNGGTSSGMQHRQSLHRFGNLNAAYHSSPDHFNGYPNDMDYTICIRKESGFCSITYQLSRGEQGPQPFAIGQSSGSGGWLNETGSLAANQWSTDCRDDYLLIGGMKLCSSGSGSNSPFYDSNGNIVAQQNNGSFNGPFGQQQRVQQNLQNQYNQLLQQLARIQQQQQFIGATSGSSAGGNVTYASNGNNNINQQQNNLLGVVGLDSNNNLEQQQAAIMQQLLLTQQQLQLLANNNNNNNGRFGPESGYQSNSQPADWQNAIITDTTSGPFLLRFVSNMARNAKGFHIDYRQNPCK